MIPDDELLSFLATPEILTHIDVFAFDETQFFTQKKEAVAFLLNNNKIVITAGLDADFRGEPFLGYTDLIAWATEVKKFKATCAQCNDFDAAHSQRLTSESQLVVVGAENYEARCSGCFYT
jgi:thymidine kinase